MLFPNLGKERAEKMYDKLLKGKRNLSEFSAFIILYEIEKNLNEELAENEEITIETSPRNVAR